MNKVYAVNAVIAPNNGKHWTIDEIETIRKEIAAGHIDWVDRACVKLGRSRDGVKAARFEYLPELRDIVMEMGKKVREMNLPQNHEYRERDPLDKLDLRLYHIERKLNIILRELGVETHDESR